MAEELERLREILSKKLPEAEVQALMAELTIAAGKGSVSIGGDAIETVIVTGSRNIVGDNNQVIVNQGTDPDELVTILREFMFREQLLIKRIPNEARTAAALDKSSLSKSEKETLQAFLLKAGKAYLGQRFKLMKQAQYRYICIEKIEIQTQISDQELFNLAKLGYLKLYADPPGIVFLPKVMEDENE